MKEYGIWKNHDLKLWSIVYMQQPVNYNTNLQFEVGTSIGLTNILKALFNISEMRKREYIFDSLLINAFTIMRNCYDKDKNKSQILNDVKIDIGQLISYFKQYVTSPYVAPFISDPYLVIYLPKYRIPKINGRKLTETNAAIERLSHEMFSSTCTTKINTNKLEHFDFYGTIVGDKGFPHQELQQQITNKFNINYTRNINRRYLLISHCAMDFHLMNEFKDRMLLLESFTGNLRSVHDLGKKVFGEEGVPFNQYTHLMFGDHTYIKQLVYRNDKKKMFAMSKQNKWNLKPLNAIKNDIKGTNIIPIELVTTLNF